ncbi:MAG: GDP-mannose 4,6-dehydratase [Solirubrobacteraceae bacterium]
MRALITGASGFAGAWLCRECAGAGDEVIALSRRGLASDGAGRGISVDLRDPDATVAAVREAEPEVVYHLAALTSVGRSWEAPAQTVGDNDLSSVNLLEALRLQAPGARVIWVSSCEVYGDPDVLPIDEDAPFAPANPYAVTKVAGELLAEVYRDAYGMDIIRARPFSHSGPGQLPIFLLSSLAQQAAEGRRAGVSSLRIVTGNPDTRRDFTDVRDIVGAYRLLAAADAPPGAVYNVSSGTSISAAHQVALLAEVIAPITIEHVIDPSRVRAKEVMDLRGDPSRLAALTGWAPKIPLRQTMSDTVDWWERELARASG